MMNKKEIEIGKRSFAIIEKCKDAWDLLNEAWDLIHADLEETLK